MKRMNKRAAAVAVEEVVYWGRAALVLVVLFAAIYIFWPWIVKVLEYIGGLFRF